jgi:hypothetical protein
MQHASFSELSPDTTAASAGLPRQPAQHVQTNNQLNLQNCAAQSAKTHRFSSSTVNRKKQDSFIAQLGKLKAKIHP